VSAALQEKRLSERADRKAPDGANVRFLCDGEHGGMAHFELLPGATSRAIRHRTVEEIWFVVAGHGVIWRELDGIDSEIVLEPNLSLTIPTGTAFQFKNDSSEPLHIIGITMPPWPGKEEAIEAIGPWQSTFEPSTEGVDEAE
jgi:mannose-6-phosphate isomerase-like protein (cupin superfamily)